MRAFLKLSIAAAAIGLLFSANAFAGTVETGSDAQVKVAGWIAVGAHYTQLAEPLANDPDTGELVVGDAPPATLEVSDRANLIFTGVNGPVTLHWEFWQQDGALGGIGNEQFGWVTWNVTDAFQIDVGKIQDPAWSERPMDWETFISVNAVGTNGVYAVNFPEHTTGIDFTFKAGEIAAGLLWSTAGLASGARGGAIGGALKSIKCGEDAAGNPTACPSFPGGASNNPAGGQQVGTYLVHVTYTTDFLWIAALYSMESGQTYGDDPDTTAVDPGWNTYSDSAMTVSGKVNLGVGRIKFIYSSASGDTYDAQDALFGPDGLDTGGLASPSDLGIAYHHFLGDAYAFVEYESLAAGTVDDTFKEAAATYVRIGYRMPIAANSNIQFEYEMQDLAYSSQSAPGVGWVTSW
jgi:hypothetical protein